jgi:hypothetical protein
MCATAPTSSRWPSRVSTQLNPDSLMNILASRVTVRRIQYWSAGAVIHAGGPLFFPPQRDASHPRHAVDGRPRERRRDVRSAGARPPNQADVGCVRDELTAQELLDLL